MYQYWLKFKSTYQSYNVQICQIGIIIIGFLYYYMYYKDIRRDTCMIYFQCHDGYTVSLILF